MLEKIFNVVALLALIIVLFLIIMMVVCAFVEAATYLPYNYAYLTLPNGEVIEGKLDTEATHYRSNIIKVVIDGVPYTASYENIVLTFKED